MSTKCSHLHPACRSSVSLRSAYDYYHSLRFHFLYSNVQLNWKCFHTTEMCRRVFNMFTSIEFECQKGITLEFVQLLSGPKSDFKTDDYKYLFIEYFRSFITSESAKTLVCQSWDCACYGLWVAIGISTQRSVSVFLTNKLFAIVANFFG